MASKEIKSVLYTGGSMYPSFRNLDRLFYIPYSGRKINPGDVVVIDAPIGKKVVHRIFTIDGDKIVTMGDYCLKPDPWTVGSEQILGQVVSLSRGEKQTRVHGGLRGRLYAFAIRCMRCIMGILGLMLRPLNDMLAGTMARKPFSNCVKVFGFQRPDGREMQLLIGRWVVGRRMPGRQWQIMPPFKLFLNRKMLDGLNEKND